MHIEITAFSLLVNIHFMYKFYINKQVKCIYLTELKRLHLAPLYMFFVRTENVHITILFAFSSWCFLGHFWATVCKTVRPMLSVRCSVCPVCNVRALWPNSWTDQDETWQACKSRPWPHCVRWGPSSPPLKEHSPNFRHISVAAKWLHGSRCHLVWR